MFGLTYTKYRSRQAVLAAQAKVLEAEDLGQGVQPHSSTTPYSRYVIFAVGDITRAAAFRGWATSQNVPFKSLLGQWKGHSEASFIVEDTSTNRLRLAYWLAGQEAVMCLGPAYRLDQKTGLMTLFGNREAILDYLANDGYEVLDRKPVGYFSAVARATAMASEGWTFDPASGTHYTLVQRKEDGTFA